MLPFGPSPADTVEAGKQSPSSSPPAWEVMPSEWRLCLRRGTGLGVSIPFSGTFYSTRYELASRGCSASFFGAH